jgi:hypothetical protein
MAQEMLQGMEVGDLFHAISPLVIHEVLDSWEGVHAVFLT